jgi:hypothetical protein
VIGPQARPPIDPPGRVPSRRSASAGANIVCVRRALLTVFGSVALLIFVVAVMAGLSALVDSSSTQPDERESQTLQHLQVIEHDPLLNTRPDGAVLAIRKSILCPYSGDSAEVRFLYRNTSLADLRGYYDRTLTRSGWEPPTDVRVVGGDRSRVALWRKSYRGFEANAGLNQIHGLVLLWVQTDPSLCSELVT